ncbi:MAG: hypothetical protein M3P53_12160 [Actinomycetota bacterium]|nr:hypothetical protein [Actinomycetota bacterium]
MALKNRGQNSSIENGCQLLRFVADLDDHRDELCRPRRKEQSEQQLCSAPSLEVRMLLHGW